MKTKLIDKTGKAGKEVELPKVFSGRIRADILQKVFEVQKATLKNVYGSMIGAGAGYSASGISIKARHQWKGTYGKGISRVPRKIMSRNGASFNWVGATVASARGGRKPHAPKTAKNLFKKINKKELVIAFGSGFAGTVDSKSIEDKYGKKIDSGFVVSADVLKLKTKDFVALLKAAFGENYEKALKVKKVRAGKGTMRGRKYRSSAGLLVVIGSEEKMNRKGVDVVNANELLISDLAPNGVAGRLAVYSEEAVKEIAEKFK